MKHLIIAILTIAFLAPVCPAQEATSHPVNIFVLRTAEQLQSPHVLTYRVAEWEQMRGRWIPFDIGYYDTGYGKDQIWFVAAGLVPTSRPRFRWEQEFYVLQEAGPEAQNKRFFWFWPVLGFQPTQRLSAVIVPYPTIPLDREMHKSLDIDRAKLEWNFNSHWRAGAGYSGGFCSGDTWVSEPFLTATRNTPLGSVETWLQRIPGGAQVQFRYTLVRSER